MKIIAIMLLSITSLTIGGCVWVPEGRYHDEPRRGGGGGWHHDHWHDDHWR